MAAKKKTKKSAKPAAKKIAAPVAASRDEYDPSSSRCQSCGCCGNR